MPQVSVGWTGEDGVGRATGGITSFVIPPAGDWPLTEGAKGVVVMVTELPLTGPGGGTTR